MNDTDKRLTRSLKNNRDRKDFLRTEINHATDPKVRLELTKMLMEIEKEEKNKKRLKWISVVIILAVIIFTLYYLGSKPPKESIKTALSETTETTLISEEQPINQSTTSEPVLKETNLSEEELKKWVMAILELAPPPPTRYILSVKVNDTDHLAYIYVGIDQLDGAGTYRVNEKGQLEFMPYMGQHTGVDEWLLISEKYMDTSLAEIYYKEQAKYRDRINADIQQVKDYLIGKTFTLIPILYDDIDSEQAMNDNMAPRNLIHDGSQVITFKDDSTIYIELLGTYRPNYDETYTVSQSTINIKDYYIPYKFNDGVLSLSTWTTVDVDGHIITWEMAEE